MLACREAAENLCNFLGHLASLCKRLEALVHVGCVPLFSRTDGADNDKLLLFVDAVDDAMSREFVLPVKIQWRPQGKSVTMRIRGDLLRQSFPQFIFYASVQSLDVAAGVAGEHDGISGRSLTQGLLKTSSMV